MKIEIYADGANIGKMIHLYQTNKNVKGFTTNPTLMQRAGVQDYKAFAKQAVTQIKYVPISFEVFADTLEGMEKEAYEIASWGDNIYVKIPIVTTKGEMTTPVLEKLSKQGIKLNVTALFLSEHIAKAVDAFSKETENIVSVFAGRIADSGIDPLPIMKEAVEICASKAGTKLLWASPREVFNIIQAEQIGCDIITCTPELIAKMKGFGKPLEQCTLETVRMFYEDSQKLGYTIL